MKYLINNRKFSTITIKVPDLIKNRYNSCELDHVWFVDFTCLGHFWALFVIEAASKRIVAYHIKEGKTKKCSFTVEDCILVYNKAFIDNGEPEIIHSDRGGQFLAKKYANFLAKVGIKQSMVDSAKFKFGNQVIERFFKTLKMKLSAIDTDYKQCTQKGQLLQIIDQIIQNYNDTIHKSLPGVSPNHMQDALTLYYQNNNNKNEGLATNNTTSFKSAEVDKIKATVVQKYAGDWITFFIEWRNTIVSEIKQEIRSESQRVIDHQSLEIQELTKFINILQQSLSEMQKKAFEAEAALKAKQEQRLRRRTRARLPTRDPAGFYELTLATQFVCSKNSSSFVKAREIVSLTILYYTGLRISNLLLLQVRHIKQLIDEYKFDIPLIKKKQSVVQTFHIPKMTYLEFDQYKQYFIILIQNKKDDDFVFTNENNQQLLNRMFLNRSINKVLKFVSTKTHKNIKSHSFRINLTTALIEAVGIEEASKIIGHNDIRTTEMYNRRHLSVNHMAKALSKAHDLLLKIGKRKLRIRKKKDSNKDK